MAQGMVEPVWQRIQNGEYAGAGGYIVGEALMAIIGTKGTTAGLRGLSGTTARAATEAAGESGVPLALKYKEGWTATQRAEADAKVAALNDAELFVTPVQRAGTSAASRYRSAGGVVPRGADVDHTIDLQLGGADDILNMNPLDASVNRSLGAQIAHQIRGLPEGTRICSVTICAR